MQFEAWRRMSPTEKLALVSSLTNTVLWLEREGWRRRNPDLSEDALTLLIARNRLGERLASLVYPATACEF